MADYNRCMKSVVVAGGAGFIGAHLCRRLLEDSYRVICVDDFSTGRRENISTLLGKGNFEHIEHDIQKVIQLTGVDYIYNLACPASPPLYQADPIKTMKTSVLGAINLLELAEKNNARILQASTSEVYGDPSVSPQPESYWGNVNPVGLRSCYDEGKRAAETLFFDYYRQRGTDIRVIRIFNTYGPMMRPDDGRVVSNFIVQALKGEDITIYGDGSQTRSFQYVDDLIDAMILMMSEEGIVGPVNLGNPNEFTINELAEKITAMIPTKSKIVYKPLPPDDPQQRRPNIQKAREKLGWEPKINLQEGLKDTINYFSLLKRSGTL